MYIKKNLKFALQFIKLKLLTLYEYRFNLFLIFLAFSTETIVFILFWKILLLRTSSIAGWTFPDLIMLNLFAQVFFISTDAFLHSMLELPDMIETGTLDGIITKPQSIFLRVALERIYVPGIVSGVVNFILFLAILIFFFHIKINPFIFLFALIASILGVTIFSCVIIIISSLAFFFTKVGALHTFFWSLASLINYPVTIFPSFMRFFFTFIFPLAFTATIPVLIMKNFSAMAKFLIFELVIALIIIIITSIIWKKGIANYESAFG